VPPSNPSVEWKHEPVTATRDQNETVTKAMEEGRAGRNDFQKQHYRTDGGKPRCSKVRKCWLQTERGDWRPETGGNHCKTRRLNSRRRSENQKYQKRTMKQLGLQKLRGKIKALGKKFKFTPPRVGERGVAKSEELTGLFWPEKGRRYGPEKVTCSREKGRTRP